MSAACSSTCGYCGRCTAAWERESSDIEICPDCHGRGFLLVEGNPYLSQVCEECHGRGYYEEEA